MVTGKGATFELQTQEEVAERRAGRYVAKFNQEHPVLSSD
jgi:hypothetical protein